MTRTSVAMPLVNTAGGFMVPPLGRCFATDTFRLATPGNPGKRQPEGRRAQSMGNQKFRDRFDSWRGGNAACQAKPGPRVHGNAACQAKPGPRVHEKQG